MEGQKKNERGHKGQGGQKEREGRKVVSGMDGHGARSCCSFRHRALQSG